MLILGQKACFLGPTIFEIPRPNWYYCGCSMIPTRQINPSLNKGPNSGTPPWTNLMLTKIDILLTIHPPHLVYVIFEWPLKENDNPFAILFDLIFTGIGSLYTYERQALFGLILQALLVTLTFVTFAKANLPKYGIFSLRFQHPFLIASSRGSRNYFNLRFYHSILIKVKNLYFWVMKEVLRQLFQNSAFVLVDIQIFIDFYTLMLREK